MLPEVTIVTPIVARAAVSPAVMVWVVPSAKVRTPDWSSWLEVKPVMWLITGIGTSRFPEWTSNV